MRWLVSGVMAVALAGVFAGSILAQAERIPQVGQPMPDYSFQDANGKTVRLADFKGKQNVLVVVNRGWIGYW